MDAMKMTWAEIEEKYTRSELGIIAWRSQEQVAQMDRPTKEPPNRRRGEVSVNAEVVSKGNEDRQPGQMTEAEALEYFGGLGISFPPPVR